MLFRIRNVQNNINYERKDIFHTPYNLRAKVTTCRYSISGYPSLYLGTSIKLCCEESKIASFNDITIASRLKIERNMLRNNGIVIDVLELGVKPKDFLTYGDNMNTRLTDLNNEYRRRTLNESEIRSAIIGIHLKTIPNSMRISKYDILWLKMLAALTYLKN